MTSEDRRLLLAVARVVQRLALGETFFSRFDGPMRELDDAIDANRKAAVDRLHDAALIRGQKEEQ